jgi:hypothetical protein
MALADWSFGAHGPEILVDMGTSGIVRTITCEQLTADFGSGYFGSAVIGNTKFTRKWKCTWSNQRQDRFQLPPFIIPMNDDGTYAEDLYYGTAIVATVHPDGSITYNIPDDGRQPRLTYLQRFYQRHLNNGLPFVFVDIVERSTWNPADPYNVSGQPKYLARFVPTSLQFTQAGNNNKRWSWSVEIQQVRPGYDASQD